MKVYCATNIGCVRTLNEDSYYMPVDGQKFMAVADGMGGHRAGEIASRMAVRIFSEILQQEKAPSPERLRYAFNKANRDVYLESERDSTKRGMGTTMTGLWFGESDVLLGHVGDSRAYRLRNGKIERLSNDHSYVEELVRSGVITPEMALNHPQRNVITRSIGPWPRVEADIARFDVQKGDVWLLCTDGLTRYVPDSDLELALNSPNPRNEQVGALINAALQRGGADNITVMLVTGEGDTHE